MAGRYCTAFHCNSKHLQWQILCQPDGCLLLRHQRVEDLGKQAHDALEIGADDALEIQYEQVMLWAAFFREQHAPSWCSIARFSTSTLTATRSTLPVVAVCDDWWWQGPLFTLLWPPHHGVIGVSDSSLYIISGLPIPALTPAKIEELQGCGIHFFSLPGASCCKHFNAVSPFTCLFSLSNHVSSLHHFYTWNVPLAFPYVACFANVHNPSPPKERCSHPQNYPQCAYSSQCYKDKYWRISAWWVSRLNYVKWGSSIWYSIAREITKWL